MNVVCICTKKSYYVLSRLALFLDERNTKINKWRVKFVLQLIAYVSSITLNLADDIL